MLPVLPAPVVMQEPSFCRRSLAACLPRHMPPPFLLDLQTPDGERRAVRLAAQAAAGALGSMSGQDCQDFVLRAEPLAAAPVGADSGTVCVEATLLVMRSSGEDTVGAPATGGGLVTRQPLLQQPQAGRFGVGPAVPAPPRQQPQRLPSSSWGLMSAMAGGKATPAGQQQPRAPTPQQQQPRAPSNLPNFFGSGRTQQQPTQPAGQQQVAAAAAASTSAAPPQQQQQQRVPVQRAEAPAPDQPQPAAAAEVAAAPSQAPAAADASQLRRETVGDYIAKSKMTAQSLDLSPAVSQLLARCGCPRCRCCWPRRGGQPAALLSCFPTPLHPPGLDIPFFTHGCRAQA